MTPNLGRALTILAEAECAEHFMHADVDAWSAPSECHDDVRRGEAERYRQARRHAEAIAQRPMRTIIREAKKRGNVCLSSAHPRWQRIVGRIYHAKGYPF